MQNFKYCILLTLIMNFSIMAYGQQFVGLSTSNHSGLHGIYINPASINGGKIGFYLNFMAADVSLSSNYLSYGFPSDLKGASRFQEISIENSGNNDHNSLSSAIEIRGLGMLLRLNDKNALAFSTRYRAFAQGSNISGGVANLLWNEINDGIIEDGVYENQKVQLNSDIISEAALTYARTIWQNDRHSTKIGVTGKRMFGLYAAHADFSSLSYEARNLPGGDSRININSLDAHYGYSSFSTSDATNLNDILLMKNSLAQGWGGEIGVQYEFYNKNILRLQKRDSLGLSTKLYKVKFGLAFTDIGTLNYTDGSSMRRIQLNRQNLEFSTSRFDGASWQDMDMVLNEILEVQPEERFSSFSVRLPTAINLNLDYRFNRRLYCNILWVQGLVKNDVFAIKQFDYLSINPRFESRGLELSFPLTLHNQYQDLSVGAMLRLGPIIVGSSNLLGALGIKNAYHANFYTAFVMPIQKN